MSEKYPIIFYDGVCNLCNATVQYVVKRDKKDIFRFAALQSASTKLFFEKKKFQITSDSVILFYDSRFYEQSTAALMIARLLPFPLRLWYVFIIIPPLIRNAVYNLIAKNRYHWFGRKESCMIPSLNISYKFIDM